MGFVQSGIWHDRFKTTIIKFWTSLNNFTIQYHYITDNIQQCIMYSFPTSFPIQVYKNPINIQMVHPSLILHPWRLAAGTWEYRPPTSRENHLNQTICLQVPAVNLHGCIPQKKHDNDKWPRLLVPFSRLQPLHQSFPQRIVEQHWFISFHNQHPHI